MLIVMAVPHLRPLANVDVSAEDLLRAADAVRHPVEEGVIQVRATVDHPGEAPVVSLLDVFVQGRDRVLSVFRAGPLADRRVLAVEDKVWLQIPGVARPIPISANQRLLGGVSIADLARLSFAAEYHATLRKEEELVGDDPCRVIDLRARTRKAEYATGTLWAGREDGLPRKAELSLASGKPAKAVYFEAYGREQDRPVLTRMRIVHLLRSEHGMVTTLEFTGYHRRSLAADLFDPAQRMVPPVEKGPPR